MYLHVGGETALQYGRIVGVFDLDGCSRGKDTNRFLQNRERGGRLSQTADGILPRSFTVTADDKVYLSPVTSTTLQKRLMETEKIAWIK
jgi:regulator of extracellular matrix RemA (YlzA/DUF370 family)